MVITVKESYAANNVWRTEIVLYEANLHWYIRLSPRNKTVSLASIKSSGYIIRYPNSSVISNLGHPAGCSSLGLVILNFILFLLEVINKCLLISTL